MPRDASERGRNRMPREKRRYAQAEGAASGRYLTHERIVLQRGLPEDGCRARSLDNTNDYNGILPHQPAVFGPVDPP